MPWATGPTVASFREMRTPSNLCVTSVGKASLTSDQTILGQFKDVPTTVVAVSFLPSRPKHVSLLAQNFFNRIIHQREDHDAVRMLDQLRGIVTFRTDVSYPDFYDLLAQSDLMLLDFASDDYLRIKASSTVAAAVITGVRGSQRPQAIADLSDRPRSSATRASSTRTAT
jgi:hypothetical protein